MEKYGFIITEKQHISLSSQAWQVISYDRQTFGNISKPIALAGFISRIVCQAGPLSEVLVHERLLEQRDRYTDIFANSLNAYSEEQKQEILRLYLDVYEQELENRVSERLKQNTIPGHAKKINVNKALREHLNSPEVQQEGIRYKGSIGKYIRAVLEEYAEKVFPERERIFYRPFCREFETARKIGACLRVRKQTEAGIQEYQMRPYRIMQDPVMPYNYLVGLTRYRGQKEWSPGVFRLSSIYDLKRLEAQNSPSGKITADQRKELTERLESEQLPYLAGETVEVQCRFTKKGEKMLNRILVQRPDILQVDEKGIYRFQCTERQAFQYFLRFGEDAIVVEPERLKMMISEYYTDAAEAYQAVE